MKSFSSSSFASDNAVALEYAAEAVKTNPQALFTNFQWFLYAGRDTVFFTAFSKSRFDKEMVKSMVEQMVAPDAGITELGIGYTDLNTRQSSLEEIFVSLVSSRR